MKKIFIISVCIFFNLYSFSQFKMKSDGSPAMKGHVYFHAYEGEGSSGTAYLQARDFSGSSSIGFRFRTQYNGNIIDAIKIDPYGDVEILRWPYIHGAARIGDILSYYHSGRNGKFGSAASFDFDPTGPSNGGLIMEQGNQESSGLYVDGDYAVIWSPGDQNRLLRVYDEDGMVEKWYIDGSGYAHTNSDLNRKDNIKDINNSLTQLNQLRGVKYNFKKEEDVDLHQKNNLNNIQTTALDSSWEGLQPEVDKNKYDPSTKEYYGFIAQEVEQIFPEFVETDEKGDKFVCYTQFIPVLVEALKEQQSQISTLQQIVTEHEKEILALKGEKIESTELSLKKAESDEDVSINEESTTLYQNTPNPFSQETEIKFFIPQETSTAKIYIHDLNGGQIKVYDITERGDGNLIIHGSELKMGMYTYTLVADGAIVDTKRMILTD